MTICRIHHADRRFFGKTASKNFSISSMTVSLSLHASIPEPIPSDRHKISCPFSNSKNEKLSPETTASSSSDVRLRGSYDIWYLPQRQFYTARYRSDFCCLCLYHRLSHSTADCFPIFLDRLTARFCPYRCNQLQSPILFLIQMDITDKKAPVFC